MRGAGRVRRGVAALLVATALATTPTLATALPGAPPEASFATSSNPALTGETVVFDASASESDMSGAPITKYEWDLDGDGVFEIDDDDPMTSRSYADPATIEISLRVTDDEGDTSDVATQSLTVQNRAPTASFTAAPSPALTGQTVTFDAGDSTDQDGVVVRYEWDLDGDGAFETDDNDPVTSKSYTDPTVVDITLRVTDEDRDSDVETRSLAVQDNRLPLASFAASPNQPRTGETVTFDASASQTDLVGTPITKYEWDLDGDGTFETEDNDPVTSKRYADPATVEIALRVTDGEADTDIETESLIVQNRAPVAAFGYSPTSPAAGEKVKFRSLSDDPEGSLGAVRWDLDGDGSFDDARRTTAVRAFRRPGQYKVGLKVTDSHGASDVAVRRLVVVKPAWRFIAPFPVVRIAGRVESGTRIARLSVKAARGSKVMVRCRGRSCPVGAITRRVRGRAVRFRRLERLLRPGTRIVVRVTRPGQIGKYTRFKMRARRAPARVDRCLLPGVRRPARCPKR